MFLAPVCVMQLAVLSKAVAFCSTILLH